MSSSTPYVGDYYDTLGVARDASAEEIKKAFRKLARECHPDVAGDNAATTARFNKVREAYEELIDPTRRARYDRRNQPRAPRSPTPDGLHRMAGGFYYKTGSPHGTAGRPGGKGSPKGNHLDLEDIFGDFGGSDFGFGDKMHAAAGGAPRSATPPAGAERRPEGWGPADPSATGPAGPAGPHGRSAPERGPAARQAGRDIALTVDVPAAIAARGGTVTLHYPRLRLGEDGQNLFRYEELHDLRVPPGTRHGESLRVEKYGDAGNDGTFGDLVCDIRLVGVAPPPVAGFQSADVRTPRASPPPPAAAPPSAGPGPEAAVVLVPIGVAEALLGGRIEVETPAGRVRVSIPPCTSSGTRLRLRGKGAGGADVLAELRIVVPKRLDDESRDLIERFAALNPDYVGAVEPPVR
jgi:DnaJ-class molecular chaperone